MRTKFAALAILFCGGLLTSVAVFAPNSNARTFHVGEFSLDCVSGGTLSFHDFPNHSGNTVNYTTNIDGFTKSGQLIFNGPTGSVTISLNINSASHVVRVTASWNTNGEQGNFDSGAITKDCTKPCVPTTVTIMQTVTTTVPVTNTVHDTTTLRSTTTVTNEHNTTITVPVTTTVVIPPVTTTVVNNHTNTVTLPAQTTTLTSTVTVPKVVIHTITHTRTHIVIHYKTPKLYKKILSCYKNSGVWINNNCGFKAQG